MKEFRASFIRSEFVKIARNESVVDVITAATSVIKISISKLPKENQEDVINEVVRIMQSEETKKMIDMLSDAHRQGMQP